MVSNLTKTARLGFEKEKHPLKISRIDVCR
jgi:hypothetical protein